MTDSERSAAQAVWLQFIGRHLGGDPKPFEELCAEHPRLAEELRHCHQEWSAPAPVEKNAPRTKDHSDLNALMLRLARPAGRGRRYEIECDIGRGSMGVVQRVWDRDLQRQLAMKTMNARVGGHWKQLATRFIEEAQIVAQLDHPSIVPVHDLGIDEFGRPFFVMKLVNGVQLARVFELAWERRERWNTARVLGCLLDVCEAVGYAHSKGVVHRDLKPSNIMVGPRGEVYVMDWGVARVMGRARLRANATASRVVETVRSARAEDEEPGSIFTSHGQIVGTAAYMSPEQARGAVKEVDAHSDVYAVGAMLYHYLAKRAPYGKHGDSTEQILEQVRAGPPRPLRSHARGQPTELIAICERAMSREPSKRYANLAECADDLRAYIERRVVRAHGSSSLAYLGKWLQRKPGAAAGVLMLVVGLIIVSLVYRGLLQRAAELTANQEQLQRSVRDLEAMERASRALRSSEIHPHEALKEAVFAAQQAPSVETASILLQVLDRCYVDRVWSLGHGRTVAEPIAVSRSGQFVAAPYRTGEVLLLHVEDGEARETLPAAGSGWSCAAFGGTPERLLIAGADGSLRAFDPTTRRLESQWPFAGEDSTPVDHRVSTALAVSPDGRRVARGEASGCVDLIDLTGATPPVRVRVHDGNVSFAAFDPSGAWLLTFSKHHPAEIRGDGGVAIIDVHSGTISKRLGTYPGLKAPYHAGWDPDGRWFAVAHEDGAVRVFDAQSLDPVEHLQKQLTKEAKYVAFDPVRRRLWTCSFDGLIVFDCETGVELHRFDDFGGRSATAVQFDEDMERAVVTANDGTCRIFGAEDLRLHREVVGVSRAASVHWAAGGQRVIFASSSSVWSVYADDRPFLPELQGHTRAVVQVCFDASGKEVLSASADGSARIWNARDGVASDVLQHDRPVRTARFSTDARRVLTTTDEGPARVWSRDPLLATALGSTTTTDAWFFDNDQRVVTIDDDGWLRGYDTTGHEEFAHRAHPPKPEWRGLDRRETKIWSAAWHPTRPWLATGAGAREVSVFDCAEQREVFRSEPWEDPGDGRLRVFSVAFAPDGDWLVAGGEDLWLHGWTSLAAPQPWKCWMGNTPGPMLFTDSGARVVVAGMWNGAVMEVSKDEPRSRGQLHAPIHTSRNVTSSLRLDASGKLALCADKGGNLVIFEVSPWRPILNVRASDAPLLDAAFHSDGTRVVTADAKGRVRIWPVDPLPVAEAALPPGLPQRR